MEEMKKHELFDAYLRGELSGEELDNFVVKLKEDPEFKNDFDTHALISKGIEEHRKKELKAFLKERTNRGFIGNPFGKKYTIAAAAVLAIFALMYYGINQIELQNEGLALKQEKSEESDKNRSKPKVRKDSSILEKEEEALQWSNDIAQTEESPSETEIAEEIEAVKDMEMDTVLLNEFETFDAEVVDSRLYAGRKENLSMANQSPTSIPKLTEDQLPVLEDRMVFDTTIKIKTIALAFKAEKRDSSESISKKKLRSNGNLPNTLKRPDIETIIRVEYWYSPINYAGYKYDGIKLILYSANDTSKIQIFKLENENPAIAAKQYFRIGNSYYELKANNTFTPYKAITDEKILKGLK